MEPAIRERLETFIRKKGLRRTPQRDAILDAAFASDEHFTAEELWDRVRKTNHRTSRATVYRTLSLLTEAGLLREIELGEDMKTYDPNFLNKPAHNHLVCIDCGKVLEFEDEKIEHAHHEAATKLGFRPVRETLRIEACCEKLRTMGNCPSLIQARLNKKRLPTRKR